MQTFHKGRRFVGSDGDDSPLTVHQLAIDENTRQQFSKPPAISRKLPSPTYSFPIPKHPFLSTSLSMGSVLFVNQRTFAEQKKQRPISRVAEMAAGGGSDEELKKVKTEIRAVLVCHPSKTLHIGLFLKEYLNTVGTPLPFAKFNFRTPQQFLRSLSDVVQVSGPANNIQLAAVVNHLSSHISELVDGQKTSKRASDPKRNYAFRKPLPPQYPRSGVRTRHGGPRQYYQRMPNFAQPVHGLVQSGSYQLAHSEFQPQAPLLQPFQLIGPTPMWSAQSVAAHRPPPVKFTRPGKEWKTPSKADSLVAAESDSISTTTTPPQEEKAVPTTTLRQDGTKAKMQFGEDLPPPLVPVLPPAVKLEAEGLSSDVKTKLRKVLASHPEGVSSSEFAALFESAHGHVLDLFGYSSVKELVLKNDDVFSFEKAVTRSDWTLYDARTALRSDLDCRVADNLTNLAQLHVEKIPAQNLLARRKMKHVWKEFFSENECDPTYRFSEPVITEEKMQKVKIVDMHSPALIWLQYLDRVPSLSDLMLRLNLLYDADHLLYKLAPGTWLPGLAVACTFSGRWHRAVLTSVQGPRARVLFVDYGTDYDVSVSELRKLDKRFGGDPPYALRASLFCLIPFEGDAWTKDCSLYIYNEWGNKVLFAETCSVDYQDPSIAVKLYFTTGFKEVCINELLVSKNFARYALNPKSIINESTVSTFYKYLPRWFSYSSTISTDLALCCQHVMLCSKEDFQPLECSRPPCCQLHCIQEFFRANPEVMARVWEEAVRKEEQRIVDNVMLLLEDSLVECGWEAVLTARLSCDTSTHPTAVAEADSTSSLERPPAPDVVLLTKDSSQVPPQVDSTSRTCSPQPRHTLSITTLHLNNSPVAVVSLKDGPRVCLPQLLGAVPHVPKMLARYRLSTAYLRPDWILVTKHSNPALYDHLFTLGLVEPHEELRLVRIQEIPRIIQTVDPTAHYIESLAKEVAAHLDQQVERDDRRSFARSGPPPSEIE